MKTHQITLQEKSGKRHVLHVSGRTLANVQHILGRTLYNSQGQFDPHPSAEIVIHNAEGKEIFHQRVDRLLPCITIE